MTLREFLWIEKREDIVPEERMMQWFSYAHLPPHLKEVSEQFYHLARWMEADVPCNAERTVAFRKLLEAKDAAVRARLEGPAE